MTGSGAGDVRSFYDRLAPLYHLVYEDWDASVKRQGDTLTTLIVERFLAARNGNRAGGAGARDAGYATATVPGRVAPVRRGLRRGVGPPHTLALSKKVRVGGCG